MLSASSANCGSSASRGEAPPPAAVPLAPAVFVDVDARKEDRDEGRSGVVGRDSGAGERERVRCADVDGARLYDIVGDVEGVVIYVSSACWAIVRRGKPGLWSGKNSQLCRRDCGARSG